MSLPLVSKLNYLRDLWPGKQPFRPVIIQEEPETGCWVCTSHKIKHSTFQSPAIKWKGKDKALTNVLYELKYGREDGYLVKICDNMSCVNPEHRTTSINKEAMKLCKQPI